MMKRQSCKPVLSFLDPNVTQPVRNFVKRPEQHPEQENQVKKIKLVPSATEKKKDTKVNLKVDVTTKKENSNFNFSNQWELLSPELYKDILKAEIELEHRSKVSKSFCIGTKITASHRELVVEWLIEMQTFLKTGNDVLHLAVTLMDLVLDKEVIEEDRLQLLAASSIWLSYKFYYGRIKAKNILKWCDSISQTELILFERKIFISINMNVLFTNSMTILNIHLYSMFGCEIPLVTYHASNYLLEIMLLNVDFLQESVSVRTFAAVYTALYLLQSQKITQLREIVDTRRLQLLHLRLISILRTIRDSSSFRKKSTLYKKYCSSRYSRVSVNLGMNLQ